MTPICDFLESYDSQRKLRLHMPGHKGEFPHDITEITGADSLYDSDDTQGIIARSESMAAKLFGAQKTCYSCGGSTLAIQTALALLKARGCKIIAASRYSNRTKFARGGVGNMNIKWA